MNIAVVTGASSGLGREFVRQISAKEKKIDEIWVIARREDRLRELEKISGIHIRPVPLDLTEKSSIEALKARLEAEKPRIRLLINCAGFGKVGSYKEVSRKDSEAMIDLNCRAAVSITLIAIPYMKRGDRIMEICSTSAFQPFPYLNIYAASKAFLYRYSRALRWELFHTGIKVTAVCPYWIKDTEFIPKAEITEEKQRINHYIFASKVKNVAALALSDSRLGLPVSTPGPICFLHRIAAKFIPHEIMMAFWSILRRI